MTLLVASPVSGRVVPLTEVPDPVFAKAMVGPGIAVEPERVASDALAPVDGTVDGDGRRLIPVLKRVAVFAIKMASR